MNDIEKQQSISPARFESRSESGGGRKEKIIWGLAGALLILALGGAFWLGKWYGREKCLLSDVGNSFTQPASQTGNVTLEKAVPAKQTSSAATAPDNAGQNTATQEKPDGWKTYTNNNQGYKISYPANGKIEQPDPSDFEEGSAPPEGSCVTVKLTGGYVTIYGKNNDPNQAGGCVGTGIGTEWGNIGKINFEVFGKKYSVGGMGTSSASAGYRQEFYFIRPASGESIRFGIEVNEKYAPELPYEKAKAEVLAVLKTMQHI